MALDPDILAAIQGDTEATGGGFLSGLSNVIGAPKHLMDYLARSGARLQGLPVSDDATTGSLARAAISYGPEERLARERTGMGGGYGEELRGKALEFGTDILTDPVTWAAGGLGKVVKGGRVAESILARSGEIEKEMAAALMRAQAAGRVAAPISKGATAAFTTMMGGGALQAGGQLAGTLREEGFTPKAAGEAFDVAASAGGALAGAFHLKGPKPKEYEVVRREIQNIPDADLQGRLADYTTKGRTDLMKVTNDEIARRDVMLGERAGVVEGMDPTEAQLRKGLFSLSTKRPRSLTDFDLLMEALTTGKLTNEQAVEAWTSSAKLPDVLGLSKRAEAVAGPPPTPPGELEAALRASLKEAPPQERTAQQVVEELKIATPEQIEQVLPKDFNDLLRQRGFKVPRVKQKSAFDQAQERMKADEAPRVTELPPEAGVVQPSPGGPPPAAGGIGRGVAVAEAPPPGVAGVRGGPLVPVPGVSETRVGPRPGMEKDFSEWETTGRGDPQEQIQIVRERFSKLSDKEFTRYKYLDEYPYKEGDPQSGKLLLEKWGLDLKMETNTESRRSLQKSIELLRKAIEPVSLPRGLEATPRQQTEFEKNQARQEKRIQQEVAALAERKKAEATKAPKTVLGDPIPEVKFPKLDFAGPDDKAIHFLRIQERLPLEKRDAARVDRVLKHLRARGYSEEEILSNKPSFRANEVAGMTSLISKITKWSGDKEFAALKRKADNNQPLTDTESNRLLQLSDILGKNFTKGEAEILDVYSNLMNENANLYSGRVFGEEALGTQRAGTPAFTVDPRFQAFYRPSTREMRINLSEATSGAFEQIEKLKAKGRKFSEQQEADLFTTQLETLALHESGHTIPGGLRHSEGEVTFNPELTAELGEPTFTPPKGKLATKEGFQPLIEQRLGAEAAVRPGPYREALRSEGAASARLRMWRAAKDRWVLSGRASEYGAKAEQLANAPVGAEAIPRKISPIKYMAVEQFKKGESEVAGMASIDLPSLKKRLDSMKKLTKSQKEEILQVAKKDPTNTTKLEEALQAADNPTLFQKALEAWKAGLLSAPSTLLVQGSDILETGTRMLESRLAPLVDKLLGGPRTRFSGEAKAEVRGFLKMKPQASKQFAEDLRSAIKLEPEAIDPDRPLEYQTGKIGGKTGRVVRLPFRLMNATSKFLRTTGTGAELSKLSFREAKKALPGASEKALFEKAEEIYTRALKVGMVGGDESYASLREAAKKGGKSRVFEDEPGPFMDALLKLRNENPWMHTILPFLHVPGNITKLIAQRSPLGFIKGAKSYMAFRRALKADDTSAAALESLKGKAVDDLTRPLLGTAAITAFVGAASLGNMTGGGPVDKRKRNLLLASGWQPYSFVLPGEFFGEKKGTKFYVPYKRVQPIGALLGFAADLAEATSLKTKGDQFDKGLESLGQNLTSQTYLQGLGDAMEFISDPKAMAAQYLSSQAGSLVPNVFAKVAQTIDPLNRETRSFERGAAGALEGMLRAVQARIPFASRALPAKISQTGEEIERPGTAVTRLLSYTQPTLSKPNAELIDFLQGLDVTPGLPSKEVEVRGVKVPLEEKEWKDLSKSNKEALAYIQDNYLNDAGFRALPKFRQRRYVESVFSRFRERAKGQMIRSTPLGGRVRAAVEAEG